ncbi:unnamed protein product [Rotaria sp. Silwood2]|nr:unnamed protein product [Rotaria sp. Silwood2]CAF2840631.1 unnamed protein product [Rotaria sp. Silwood2]CAF3165054.1 unnamed protein product [Rotaria sp. Silwood2]
MQKNRIAATASQKLCLFRLFPFIFNDFIHAVPSIIVYKQLRDILDLILSTPFRKQWLPVLRDLCIGFHESMLLHFPTKMIPKVHFACEYDQIINDFGPSEREKLLTRSNDDLIQSDNSSSVSSNNLNLSSSSSGSISDNVSKEFVNNVTSASDQSLIVQEISGSFPDKYVIPPMPNALAKDIQEGALYKFGPHCSNRQILIECIVDDMISQYNLFYPNHKQFQIIGESIVEYLKLPLIQQNIILLSTYNDKALQEIQTKAEKLRNVSQIDLSTQLQIWQETVHFRRQSIRNRLTAEILREFPGYSNPLFVFEEVKITMNVDLSAVVRQQIPVLLDKMVEVPAFITDSPAIRLVKVLCRHFDETVHHTFSDTEPSTPYPTLIFINDQIHVYVDFIPIVSTTSPDDAVALLIAMYSIFELNFNRNSRAIRFLYSILHSDKRFLSNAMRLLIKEKDISICKEINQEKNSSSHDICTNSTVLVSDSQISTNINIITEATSINEENEYDPPGETNSCSSNYALNSNIKRLINANESSQNVTETSSSLIDSQNQKIISRKRTQGHTTMTEENQNSIVVNYDEEDHDLQENIIPSNDSTSDIVIRKVKRKRRY